MKNFLVNLSYIILLSGLNQTEIAGVEYSAITDSINWNIPQQYLKEWNDDPPSPMDPTTNDEFTRLRICQEISNSGFFRSHDNYAGYPLTVSEMYSKLKAESKYSHLCDRMYKSVESGDENFSYEYVNPYFEHVFRIKTSGVAFVPKKERVFVCLLREKKSNDLKIFHVSKAYNLLNGPQHVHYFVFPQKRTHGEILLAEASGEAVTWPHFNVELHYLEMKKRYKQIRSKKSNLLNDPIGRLSVGHFNDNHLFRLCTIVLSSSYFRDKVLYGRRAVFNSRLSKTRIAFRTADGMSEAGGKIFQEMTLICYANTMSDDGKVKKYHISRAYHSNHVFVYDSVQISSGEEELYLENLTIGVGIVRDYLNLDDVEL